MHNCMKKCMSWCEQNLTSLVYFIINTFGTEQLKFLCNYR